MGMQITVKDKNDAVKAEAASMRPRFKVRPGHGMCGHCIITGKIYTQ